MGSVHKAACQCGFETKVVVGGAMQNFEEDSRFPFHCEHCGLVEANIAKLISKSMSSNTQADTEDAPTCPKCGNVNIRQYGKPPVSTQSDRHSKTLQAWGFTANSEGNLCPACKQMTLVFGSAHLLFD